MPRKTSKSNVTDKTVKGDYVSVNGLKMYYEIHGEGSQPLVLIHGAFSAIGTSFGRLLPGLASGRQVVAFELQAHGHTADIDRPLALEGMADDVAAAIQQLALGPADVFGYSMGAFVALQLVVRHPELVRKLVLASVSFTRSGIHPGLMEGLGEMTPEMMFGSPWHDEYLKIAPQPENFARLFTKKTEMDRNTRDLSPEDIQAIKSPTLIIIGDSDLIRLWHMEGANGNWRMWEFPLFIACIEQPHQSTGCATLSAAQTTARL